MIPQNRKKREHTSDGDTGQKGFSRQGARQLEKRLHLNLQKKIIRTRFLQTVKVQSLK